MELISRISIIPSKELRRSSKEVRNKAGSSKPTRKDNKQIVGKRNLLSNDHITQLSDDFILDGTVSSIVSLSVYSFSVLFGVH